MGSIHRDIYIYIYYLYIYAYINIYIGSERDGRESRVMSHLGFVQHMLCKSYPSRLSALVRPFLETAVETRLTHLLFYNPYRAIVYNPFRSIVQYILKSLRSNGPCMPSSQNPCTTP